MKIPFYKMEKIFIHLIVIFLLIKLLTIKHVFSENQISFEEEFNILCKEAGNLIEAFLIEYVNTDTFEKEFALLIKDVMCEKEILVKLVN